MTNMSMEMPSAGEDVDADGRAGEVNECLQTRQWFYFLASSLITFLAGLMAILTWRILDHFAGCTVRRAISAKITKPRGSGGSRDDDDGNVEIKVGIGTKIKWKCEKIISGQTFVGRIMVALSCLFSIGSLVIYMSDATGSEVAVESCDTWSDNVSQQIDLAFNLFFLVYFVIRFLASNDKIAFWVDVNSIVDLFTIPPVFVGFALNRNWLGLRFLRAIRLMAIPDILQYMSVLRTSNGIRLAQLVTIFVSVWFAAAGFIHLVENTGDPWMNYSNANPMSYWESAYFTVVTMSTVGYGDIYCKTTIGRSFIVFFIFGALAMFASFIPAIAEIVGRRQRYGGFYEQTVGVRHVVLCGHITYESVHNFLRDFLHEDRQKNNVKCIFLDNKQPDLELEALFKRTFTKVEFFKGSIMSTRDLERVKLQYAEACLIMANPRSPDPDSEDASNIMRVISIKNFCSRVRVIVQLIRFNNKAFCVNLPAWSTQDQVICLAELKLGFMASGCLAPGFSTLLANLFVMRSYKKSSKWLEWQDKYLEGAGMEVYTEYFSPAFHGLSFPVVAEKCYVHLRLLLVAVAIKAPAGQNIPRLVLNPSGRGRQATIINANTKGFFICQSEDEAKRVIYYCDKCHGKMRDPERISSCRCHTKTDHTTMVVELSAESQQLQAAAEQYSFVSKKLQSIKPSGGEYVTTADVDINVNQKLRSYGKPGDKSVELFEATGLFHWCPKRSFKSCILSHDRNRDIARQLKNHVVVCCFSNGAKSPVLGLCNFVMPLRASNLRADQLRAVVLIGDYSFLEKEWPSLCNFPAVYVRPGLPLNRYELRSVRVNRCHMCVIMTTTTSALDDPTIVDKESILCSLNIKTMNFQQQQQQSGEQGSKASKSYSQTDKGYKSRRRHICGASIPMLTELANDYNVQFLDQDDDDDPDIPLYMTQPFACGRAFAASVLDSLMSTTFFHPELLNLLRTLVMGGDARELEQLLAEGVGMIRTDDELVNEFELEQIRNRCHLTLLYLDHGLLKPFAHGAYGDLVVGALTQYGILCIGLYRLMVDSPVVRNTSSDNRYVITNPPRDLDLRASDRVYCLKPYTESSSIATVGSSTPASLPLQRYDDETRI